MKISRQRRGTGRPTGTEASLDGGQGKGRFKMAWGNTVQKREIDWLWYKWLPRGMLTLFTGDPQAGKSTALCELAACITTGRPLPGERGPARPPGKVWMMSSEDAADTTTLWRLENQGADTSRVLLTDEKTPLSTSALKEMEQVIRREGFVMVVIDTLTTWMGGDIDMNSASQVMDWLEPLKGIAERTNCAIVLVRHRRKGPAGDNKLHSGMGSIGFTAAVRSEMMAIVNKDGSRFMERTKGNIGSPPSKLAYEIVDNDDPTNPHGIFIWRGEYIEPEPQSRKKKQDKISTTPKALGLAQDFLRARLAGGPVDAKLIVEEGIAKGISERTLQRAKKGLVRSVQVGKGEWVWMLDEQEMLICR